MRQGGRLALAKGHATRLIEQAAQAGDHVALLSFGGSGVELLVPPSPARAAISTRVRKLGGGGGTPLSACLLEAGRLLHRAQGRKGLASSENCWLWLLTDGRTLEQPSAPEAAGHIVIIDFEQSSPGIGRCAAWARQWGAEHRRAESPT